MRSIHIRTYGLVRTEERQTKDRLADLALNGLVLDDVDLYSST